MHLELTEEQEILRDTTRSFLESEAPLAMVRDLYSSPEGFDRQWWQRVAELGWTSLLVPETLGGGSLSGQPTADAVIVAEAIGRLVAPGPFLPVNLVASALGSAGSDEQQAAGAPRPARRTTIAMWAFSEPNGQWETAAITTTAIPDHGGVVSMAPRRTLKRSVVPTSCSCPPAPEAASPKCWCRPTLLGSA